MKNLPLLDSRNKEELLRHIERLAAAYTPGWRFNAANPDAGAALAILFADMFQETIDRFNAIPYKNFIAFLNMLKVSRNSATPAYGYVRFEANALSPRGVHIPGGTQVYALMPGDEGVPIPFETQRGIDATAAEMTQIFCVDGKTDSIIRLDLSTGAELFFGYDPARNLQKHMLGLGCADVLLLKRPSFIELKLQTVVESDSEQAIRRLADADFASWGFYDGQSWRPFDGLEMHNDALLLKKESSIPIVAGEEEPSIRCVMRGNGEQSEIVFRSAGLRSGPLSGDGCQPDFLFCNDDPVELTIGGYCFGRDIAIYDAFYIGCEEVLIKHGATVELELDIKTVVVEQMTDELFYEFRNKYIIDKSEKRVELPEIYVSHVIWEYWNEIGWAHLKVEGDENPFSCRSAGKKHLRFVCPEDMRPLAVNAVESYFIRARVAFVENAFDPAGRKMLPFVQDALLSFAYKGWRKPSHIVSVNNLAETVIENADTTDWGEFTAFARLEDDAPTVYIGFDRPLSGYPVSMYLDVEGLPEKGRNLAFEALLPGGFTRIKVLDDTDSLSGSGLVGLFIPEPLVLQRRFGEEACWLRILDLSSRYGGRLTRPVRVRSVVWNAVDVRQYRTMPEEVFPMAAYEVHKQVRLSETPAQDCEVWVDEHGNITPAEREALLEAPGSVEIVSDYGEETAFLVKYGWVENFALCTPSQRCYTLESTTGLITFGDDVHGRIPPVGPASIRVRYRAGGGSAGNLGEGAIRGMMNALPNVDNVVNFLPTCGGNDEQRLEVVEQLGPKRIMHRYRAQTADDYESLVLERFNEVCDVRCFANTGAAGARANGYVTVVVAGREEGDAAYCRKLCERILSYLHTCCDSTVCVADRLKVIPAVTMEVNVLATVELSTYDDVAATEQQILHNIRALLDKPRHDPNYRRIGYRVNMPELYAAIKANEAVAAIRDVMIEGVYYENDIERMVTLDGKKRYPFFILKNGTHLIRI